MRFNLADHVTFSPWNFSIGCELDHLYGNYSFYFGVLFTEADRLPANRSDKGYHTLSPDGDNSCRTILAIHTTDRKSPAVYSSQSINHQWDIYHSMQTDAI